MNTTAGTIRIAEKRFGLGLRAWALALVIALALAAAVVIARSVATGATGGTKRVPVTKTYQTGRMAPFKVGATTCYQCVG
jgi:hypothetical protein